MSVAVQDIPLSRIHGHLLRRAQQVHNQIWLEEVGTDLTSAQYGLLTAVAAYPGVDQRQLAGLASLDKSSTADVVARLEGRLWIARERDPRDARRRLVFLAPAAALALDHLTPSAQVVQERLLAFVSPDDRVALIDGLRRIARLDSDQIAHDAPESPAVLRLDAPGHLIRSAQQVHTGLWLEAFGREITGPQYAAMQVLAKQPGINQRELGDRAGLDKSTAADIIQRLVTRGWIVREHDPLDGRGRLLRLSPAAAEVVDEQIGQVMRIQEELIAPLPEVQRDTFLRALTGVAYAGESTELS